MIRKVIWHHYKHLSVCEQLLKLGESGLGRGGMVLVREGDCGVCPQAHIQLVRIVTHSYMLHSEVSMNDNHTYTAFLWIKV